MTKRPIARIALGAAAALFGLVIAPVLTASAASAAPAGGGAYTCTGGDISPGTYSSMLITGVCYMRTGTVVVRGNLTVAPGALLDAGANPGDPSSSPVVTATVQVGGNVFVGKGAVLVLGCSPNLLGICPNGLTFDSIGGNLVATGALADVVHGTTVRGNVSVLGGGGGAADGAASGGCFDTAVYPIPAPWSADTALANQVPQYTDFEDSSIGGNFTVIGVQTCWMGALRVLVGGSVTVTGNVTSDPDGMEFDNNLMSGNMTCLSNDPAVQFGDSSAAPNLVGGIGIGECGFGVVLDNPAPEADETPIISEHITVRTSSLKTYYGTHTATPNTSLQPVLLPDNGYTITADLNNFTMAGTGLVGSGTFNPTLGPEVSGDGVLSTVYPNGSKSFIAYDACSNCSLGGQVGTALLRFYGTTSPNGVTFGTFLITSGGGYPVVPGETGNGALGTLAGWGTFSSAGQPAGTWRLVEHLRIT